MAEQMKQPVLHNEELEAQIKVFRDAQTKDNMVKVLQLLDKTMIMQPALLPANVTPQMMQQMAKAGSGPMDPGMRPQPVVFKNNNGDSFLPIFTSKQQIPEGQKYPAMLFVPFKECAKIAAKPEAKLNGIVVNPFTDNLVLHQAAFQGAVQNANPVAVAVQKVEELSGKQKQAICCNKFVEEMAKRFFREKEAFFDFVGEKKEETVCELFQTYYESQKMDEEFSYLPDDFDVMSLYISDTIRLVRIGMPDKNMVIGSYTSALMFFNPTTGQVVCYGIKKGEKKKGNTYGEIDGNGKYSDLGEAPGEGEELYSLMGKLPWAKE